MQAATKVAHKLTRHLAVATPKSCLQAKPATKYATVIAAPDSFLSPRVHS